MEATLKLQQGNLAQSMSSLKPQAPTFAAKAARPSLSGAHSQRLNVTCTATAPAEIASGVGAAPKRVFNFSAGPATLPLPVIEQAQIDLVSWQGSGMSVMEMSHRGKEFMGIAAKTESDLRTLLDIPENYAVLFLQGGATNQFSSLPLNLCPSPDDVADYIVTGSWGDKAQKEASRFCSAKVAATGKPGKYTSIPAQDEWKLTPGAKFVHICSNETIQGVEFKEDPTLPEGSVLVADMSSNFCSKPIDISKYGVIYAGAQKNIGPAGVTVVIVRKDLIGHAREGTPVMLDWKTHAENESMYNTPPCFSMYMCGLVFEHLLKLGGLKAVEKANQDKAALLYNAIDSSDGFYKCPVDRAVRSLMNVPFTMSTPELEAAFLKGASQRGMIQLKGHRSVGGVRASIYNAMPREGVQALVDFMEEFRAQNA